jgi:hypothetical protein
MSLISGEGGEVIVYLIKNGGDVCQKQPILIFLYLQSIPCKQECDWLLYGWATHWRTFPGTTEVPVHGRRWLLTNS